MRAILKNANQMTPNFSSNFLDNHVCLLFTCFQRYKRHTTIYHVTHWTELIQLEGYIFDTIMEHEIVYDPENKVDYRHGYYMFFSSIISFSILNFIVFKIGKPKSVKDDEWRWRNLLISWIHGLICGTWDFLWYNSYTLILF